jgi:cytochrome b pre-mRNA-processing protein 3
VFGLSRLLTPPAFLRDLDTLEETVSRAARRSDLFGPGGIEDTFDGRFDSLTHHAILLQQRLAAEGEPGRKLGQAYADRLFRSFDHALREIGVGDFTIPKKVRKLSEAFHGRAVGLLSALDSGEDAQLDAVLAKNLFSVSAPSAEVLRRFGVYTTRLVSRLSDASLADVIAGPAWVVALDPL